MEMKNEVKAETKRSCNRHDDCDKANAEWLADHTKERFAPFNIHCHDENCEDCFGC
jgi:hypothetical protein